MKKSGLCLVLKNAFKLLNVVVVLVVVAELSFAETEETDSLLKRNQQIAEVYADSAFVFLWQGNYDTALEIADAALSFYPASADALVVKYFILKSRKKPLEVCIELLEAALQADTFKNFYKEDILVRYCHELISIQRIYEALKASEAIVSEPERWYIMARAQLALGNYETALEYYKSYISINPDSIECIIPWLMQMRKNAYSAQAASFIEYIKTVLLNYIRFDHPDILPALVPFAGDTETAKIYLREYRAYNRNNAYATYYAYEFGLISWDTMLDELFVQNSVVPYEIYETVAQRIPTPDALSVLRRKLAAWKGFIIIDRNYDAIPEMVLEINNGLSVYAYRDADQNGIYEASVQFADGIPESCQFSAGSTMISVTYFRWPHVREITVSNSSGTRTYYFGPGAFSLPLVEQKFLGTIDKTVAIWYDFPARIAIPTEDALVKNCIKVDRNGNNTFATVKIASGVPLQSMQNDAGYKIFTMYHDGFPVLERIDINADGKFDGVRMYIRNAQGVPVLAETRIDSDSNGVYEYIERYSPALTKIWDTNQDGIQDIIVTEETNGVLKYDAAIDMSGTFPLIVYIKNNVPIRVLFKGEELPLINDTNSRIYWIGIKYFDFGQTVPQEGWGIINGKRYFVLRIQDLLFVQALNQY
ncbi:MAG TPA: tetratricopeptide repeat protein [Spirochaetales bacterium]|nr:tetratricopeptide repeat protein [Spirochaetales bacterium]